MMIEGISHITLVVRDIERTAALYKSVLGAKEVYRSGEKQFSIAEEAFFEVGGVWLCLMKGQPDARQSYTHIAFRLPAEAIPALEDKLRAHGIAPIPGRKRIPGEGRSLYFADYDGYLFELHAGTLTERLRAYANAQWFD